MKKDEYISNIPTLHPTHILVASSQIGVSDRMPPQSLWSVHFEVVVGCVVVVVVGCVVVWVVGSSVKKILSLYNHTEHLEVDVFG